MQAISILFLGCALTAVTACSSTPDTSAPAPNLPVTGTGADVDGGEPPAGSGPWAKTYALFAGRCAGCHSPTGTASGLNLEGKDVAYASLVGKPTALKACLGGGRVLVVPGKPEESVLYRKLARTQDCGDPMPKGKNAVAFTAEENKVVADWITAGAPRD